MVLAPMDVPRPSHARQLADLPYRRTGLYIAGLALTLVAAAAMAALVMLRVIAAKNCLLYTAEVRSAAARMIGDVEGFLIEPDQRRLADLPYAQWDLEYNVGKIGQILDVDPPLPHLQLLIDAARAWS